MWCSPMRTDEINGDAHDQKQEVSAIDANRNQAVAGDAFEIRQACQTNKLRTIANIR